MVLISSFRLIQEEKENTEARAEELEYRVSSLDHLVANHVPVTGSGRSTPRVSIGAAGGGTSSNHSPVVPSNPPAGYPSNANPSNSSSPLANQANLNSNAAASPQRDYLHKFHTVSPKFERITCASAG